MVGVIKEVKEVESIQYSKPRIDLSIFRKRTSAKTSSGLVLAHAKKFKKDGNVEMAIFLQELYKKIRGIEEEEKAKLESWKGKSSFRVITKPDRYKIITYQKPFKGAEPKQITREIYKKEVNDVLYWIHYLNNTTEGNKVPTSEIAERYYKIPWKKVFSDRGKHTQLNLILRLLDYKEITLYRGGNTYVLEKIEKIK